MVMKIIKFVVYFSLVWKLSLTCMSSWFDNPDPSHTNSCFAIVTYSIEAFLPIQKSPLQKTNEQKHHRKDVVMDWISWMLRYYLKAGSLMFCPSSSTLDTVEGLRLTSSYMLSPNKHVVVWVNNKPGEYLSGMRLYLFLISSMSLGK